MMHFFLSGGKFNLCTTINDGSISPETQSSTGGIHRYVSATDHTNAPSCMDRSAIIVAERFHKIVSGKKFVGRKDSVQVFSRNTHEFGKSCSGADEYSLEALIVHKGIDGDGSAYDNIGFNPDTKGPYFVDFMLENLLLGKAELRNTIFEHSAGFMKSFKDGDIVSRFGEVAGTGKSRRAGTDDGNFTFASVSRRVGLRSIFSGAGRLLRRCIRKRPVGNEPLEFADGNGLTFDAEDA